MGVDPIGSCRCERVGLDGWRVERELFHDLRGNASRLVTRERWCFT